MPVYHSTLNEDNSAKLIANVAIMPLKTKFKGPAPQANDQAEDIIDEALNFFKANVFFRNFEVKGPADRVLVYLTLYISQCLKKISGDKSTAEKAMYQLAIENFPIPGDKSFVLGGIVTNPANRAEADTLRQYFTQLRQETGLRLVQRVYKANEKVADKWWMCFTKRKFLNKEL